MNSENKFHHPQRNLGQNFKLSEAPNPPHFIAAETCWGKANRVSLKAKTIDQHLFNFSARYPLDIKSEGHSLISRLLILLQILLFRPSPPLYCFNWMGYFPFNKFKFKELYPHFGLINFGWQIC